MHLHLIQWTVSTCSLLHKGTSVQAVNVYPGQIHTSSSYKYVDIDSVLRQGVNTASESCEFVKKLIASPWPRHTHPFSSLFVPIIHRDWAESFSRVRGEHTSPRPLLWLERLRGLEDIHLGCNKNFFFFCSFFGGKHCCCGFYLCIVNGFLGESVKKL